MAPHRCRPYSGRVDPRLLIAVAGGVFAIACTSPTPSPAPKTETTASSEPQPILGGVAAQNRAVNVTRMYEDNCGKCHGMRAEGGSAKSLVNLDKFDQKWDVPFFNTIKKGNPDWGMDEFGATHSDEEVWSLVVHIRELQNAGLRAGGWKPKESNGLFTSKYENYKVETVSDRSQNLKLPWSISFLPDGRMLITERSGQLKVARDGKVVGQVKNLPPSRELGQGGLMDVIPHPDFAENGWIYIAIADPKKDGSNQALTKIVRGKITWSGNDGTWGSQQTIFEAPQKFYNGAGIHFGGKIAFDGKGHVFFSIGERGGNMASHTLDVPWGKIYRLNDDGSVPSDNPYKGSPFPGIWTWGHRNPQALIVRANGEVWDTEHAPRGGDELNYIQKGNDYGWPVVSFGINYNDSPFVVPWPKPDQKITMPALRWLPSIATSGMSEGDGKMFPKWKGDLFAGGLAGQTVRRLRVSGGKLVEEEEVLFGRGRVRDVRTGPEGAIYVVLNEPDVIVRLVAAK